MCIETGKIFYTTVEAAEFAGIASNSKITECCKEKRKTAGGFHWGYALSLL